MKTCYNVGNLGVLPMKSIKVIVEKHQDGYVAYPLGIKGAVVGQGETYEAALADVKSAIRFHVETFGESPSKLIRQSWKPLLQKPGSMVDG